MDVPAPAAGVVKEISVKVGDKVSQGSRVVTWSRLRARLDRRARGRGRCAATPEAGRRREPTPPTRRRQRRRADAPPAAASEPAPAPAATPTADGSGCLREPVGAAARARARRRPARRDRQRPQGPDHQGRRRSAAADGGAGRAPAPRPPAARARARTWRRGRSVDFEKFGPVERVAAHADPADLGAEPGPQLGDDPARHPQRRGRHHRARGVAQAAQRRAERASSSRWSRSWSLACVATLKEFPNFNSSLDGDELVLKRYYNIGFAADTPGGLVVPVIKDADHKGLLEIARRADRAVGQGARGQARAGRHERRHVHDLLARRDRRHLVHADHQRARGRDPRRDAVGDQAGLERRRSSCRA